MLILHFITHLDFSLLPTKWVQHSTSTDCLYVLTVFSHCFPSSLLTKSSLEHCKLPHYWERTMETSIANGKTTLLCLRGDECSMHTYSPSPTKRQCFALYKLSVGLVPPGVVKKNKKRESSTSSLRIPQTCITFPHSSPSPSPLLAPGRLDPMDTRNTTAAAEHQPAMPITRTRRRLAQQVPLARRLRRGFRPYTARLCM